MRARAARARARCVRTPHATTPPPLIPSLPAPFRPPPPPLPPPADDDVMKGNADYTHAAWAAMPQARALCTTLLSADRSTRPSPAAVLTHPWLVAAVHRDKRINLSLRYLDRVSSMRGLCLRSCIAVLPQPTRTELQAQFDAIDSDTKGYLNPSDVRRALKPPKSKQRRKQGKGERASGRSSSVLSSEASAGETEIETAATATVSAAAGAESAEGGVSVALSSAAALILRRLLQSALEDAGVGKKHREQRGGRKSMRAAHGARRVGVVSFSMFVEAALEEDLPLVRRLWSEAFALLDADADGVVGADDLAGALRRLGLDGGMGAPEREEMLEEAGCNATSKELLRLVLKGERTRPSGAPRGSNDAVNL